MKRAFTLIELLVVISIIGILAGAAFVSYGSAQERSRDSRRKTDLDAIKKALELAKNDSAGAYAYPACDAPDASGNCVIVNTNTNPDLSTTYIQSVPSDPKGTSWTYIYAPRPASCTSTTCTTFTLRSCLENASDSQKENPKVGCTGTGQRASYAITNP